MTEKLIIKYLLGTAVLSSIAMACFDSWNNDYERATFCMLAAILNSILLWRYEEGVSR